jgi:hypothetical protein
MHKYRLYVYDAEDRLIAPAMVISADNDEAATEQAETMLDGVRARSGNFLLTMHAPPAILRLGTATRNTFDQSETYVSA